LTAKLLISLVAGCLVLACSEEPPEFVVSQFTISGEFDDDELELNSHPRDLEFHGEGLNQLACRIQPQNEEPYVYVVVHFLPGEPTDIGHGWSRAYTPADAPNGLRSSPNRALGDKVLTWPLEPGDPNGEYRLEVHINGVHQQTLRYRVAGIPPAV